MGRKKASAAVEPAPAVEKATKAPAKNGKPKSSPGASDSPCAVLEQLDGIRADYVRELRTKHPGIMLLFRIGGWCRLYDEDAQVAQEALGLIPSPWSEGSVTVCTLFREAEFDANVQRLLQAGHRVALCSSVPAFSRTVNGDRVVLQEQKLAPVEQSLDGPPLGWWDVSNNYYHADTTALSHSSLEVFRESVRLYYGQFVTGKIPRRSASSSMAFGSAVHAYLLERHRFTDLVAVKPEGLNRRSKVGNAATDAFEAEHAGKAIIDHDDMPLVERIGEAVAANLEATRLLTAKGRNECAYRWQDRATGVLLKFKTDRLLEEAPDIVDIKTTRDPSPEAFMRDVYNFGYHRAAALYCDGRDEAMGGETGRHFIIAIGNTEPFDVAVYELDRVAMSIGRSENAADLARLRECRRTGIWENTWGQGVQSMTLPRWAVEREITATRT